LVHREKGNLASEERGGLVSMLIAWSIENWKKNAV
jgi:hypothetical protein